ncbi:MAG: helix-turn-helix domain-containing protein [Oscillospiraceae bacterium]|nr:helix-turn-helix domain-containing protein [Oscillospiraceae bacterium]
MIALRLRQLREEKGVNQVDVAQHLNISRVTYSQYETGKRQMNYESLDLLAGYFCVSVDYLLGRTDERGALRPNEEALLRSYDLMDERGRMNVNATVAHEMSLVQRKENK